MAEYDLRESKRSTRELYPVLVDAHGNIIDGFHRLEADPGWERKRLEHIRTPAQLWLARIVANTHRRTVSREERAWQVTRLAEALVDEGVPRTKIVAAIAELTTFSERYVRGLLPDEYKMMSKARFAEPSSADEAEASAAVDDLAPGLFSPVDAEAETAVEGEPPEACGGDEAFYALEADDLTISITRSKRVEEYVADYLSRHLKPDLDYLAWDLAHRYGLARSEARDIIEGIRAREEGLPLSKVPGEHETPRTAACPLCGRDGADLDLVLVKMEELRALAPCLPAYRWLEEALKR